MSDPNQPNVYRTPSPHPFEHPVTSSLPVVGRSPDSRTGPSFAQIPGVSTEGDPSGDPIAVMFDSASPGDVGPAPSRPRKPGVKAPRLKRLDDQGINTVSWVAASAAGAAVILAVVPSVSFAAITVSAISVTVAVWGYTLDGFRRRQSIIAGAATILGLATVAALMLFGAAGITHSAAAGTNAAHSITFEIEGSARGSDASVTWATDDEAGASTASEKNVSLPWSHTADASAAAGGSYSLWLQLDEAAQLPETSDLTCSIFVDGVPVNRSEVSENGILACSFYGDVENPEDVDLALPVK